MNKIKRYFSHYPLLQTGFSRHMNCSNPFANFVFKFSTFRKMSPHFPSYLDEMSFMWHEIAGCVCVCEGAFRDI